MVAFRNLPHDGDHVLCIILEGVIAARDPFAFAMSALVDGDGAHAVRGDPPRGRVPGTSRLAAAMQEDHGMAAPVPQIGGEAISLRSPEFDGNGHAHSGFSLRNS